MTDALIGYTGFVGGALMRARSFDALYRSTNIDEIRGRAFDTIVCCGAPAEKWKANRDPESDRARLAMLTDALADVRAEQFVLVSTVDVYPITIGVDETTPIDPDAAQPYGRHRFLLEQFCREQFDATVVRLPGLYGHGLRKNAIFDLLQDHDVQAIPGNARFQFYDVERLWADVQRVLVSDVTLVNISAEPLDMNRVAMEVFGRSLPTPAVDRPPSYDVRSVHADLVEGRDGYWFTAGESLAGLRAFLQTERAR